MEKICSELDPVQISKVFMLLLSKEYVNANAAKQFKLTKDLASEFLLIFAYANSQKLKKVSIVKEFLVPIVDYVNINQAESVEHLLMLGKYIDLNNKMLI